MCSISYLQVAVGLPLLLPFPAIRGPTVSLYHALSKGPGGYVGGTILVTITVLLGSSIWEAVALDEREGENSHQCAVLDIFMLCRLPSSCLHDQLLCAFDCTDCTLTAKKHKHSPLKVVETVYSQRLLLFQHMA